MLKSDDYFKLKPPPLPAIEERLTCANCTKTLKVMLEAVGDKDQLPRKLTGETQVPDESRLWRYVSYGHFCSLVCGCEFANKTIDETIDTSTDKTTDP